MRELSLKEIQAGSLEVLKKLKEICDKERLRFFLFFGTLIGAVREHGFIAWDDDTDVWMPRSDYEKLVDYCIEHAEELKPFELKHYKTCKDYIYPIARLSDSRYVAVCDNTKEYGLGLFVDIYPMDGFNPLDKAHLKKIQKNRAIIGMMGADKFVPAKSVLKTILKLPVYLGLKFRNLNKLLAKQDMLSRKYPFETSEQVDCVLWDKPKTLFRKDFDGSIDVTFEGVPMPIPSGYDNILSSIYGDYMTPPPETDKVGDHFYRAYKKDD